MTSFLCSMLFPTGAAKDIKIEKGSLAECSYGCGEDEIKKKKGMEREMTREKNDRKKDIVFVANCNCLKAHSPDPALEVEAQRPATIPHSCRKKIRCSSFAHKAKDIVQESTSNHCKNGQRSAELRPINGQLTIS